MTRLKLTDEQQAAVDQPGDQKLIAVAGSGKTTVLVEYAAARSQASRQPRILYLAFNATVRKEARERFARRGLPNVDVHTAHSLAYRYIIKPGKYKLSAAGELSVHDISSLFELNRRGHLKGSVLATHVKRLFSYYCNAGATTFEELSYELTLDPNDKRSQKFVRNNRDLIYQYAQLLYQKMDAGELDVTHDWYLKKFQFLCPRLPYEYILFDEGQDASQTMLEVFIRQPATKLIVGDENQQIYGFRYAVNSLRQMQAPTLALTQSFRFEQRIADIAAYVLDWKHSFDEEYQPIPVQGVGVYSPPADGGLQATIGRTNVALLGEAIESLCIHQEIGSLYFEGHFENYTYMDSGASLFDVLHLYQGRNHKIKNPLLKTMDQVGELREYIDQTGDRAMKVALALVDTYKDELPELIEQIRMAHMEDRLRPYADRLFSTVHRCKGLEYDSVGICEDFISKQDLSDHLGDVAMGKVQMRPLQQLNEEINMLYVAVTRTKNELVVSEEFYQGYQSATSQAIQPSALTT